MPANYQIVEDALERGARMKENIRDQIKKAGQEATEQKIRKVVLWNRRTHIEHTAEEIKGYLQGC